VSRFAPRRRRERGKDEDKPLPLSASLLFILVAGLALSLFCAAATPPWQVPDEPQHLQMARLLADLGHWPTLTDVWGATDMRDQIYESLVQNRFWEIRAHRSPPPSLWEGTAPDVLLPPIYVPPGYYSLAAGVLRVMGSAPLDAQRIVLRLLSALAGLAELYFIFRMSRLISPGQRALVLAATAFAAFLPMRAYITGGVSSDPLAAMASAAALWAMLAWVRRPLTPARGAALGLLLAAALLTKRTTAFLLPLLAVFLILNRRNEPRMTRINANEGISVESHGSRPSWIGAGLLFLCLVIPLVAWTLGRPALAQPGEAWPYPGGAPGGLFGTFPEWLARPFSTEAWSLSALRQYAVSLGVTFASFWGNFGWLTIPLGLEWYAALAILTGLAGLGLARAAWKQRGHLQPETALVAWAAAFALAQVVAAMVSQGIPQQGRYLFPALGPIACGLVRGWAEWLPERARRILPLAVGVGMLALFAVSMSYFLTRVRGFGIM